MLVSVTKRDLDHWAGELDRDVDYELFSQSVTSPHERGSSSIHVEYNAAPSKRKEVLFARLSWLPTPETLNSNRKGILGYWTGELEDSWSRRIDDIEKTYRPLNAGAYAKWNFGKLGKEIMRTSKEAASRVLQQYAQRPEVAVGI